MDSRINEVDKSRAGLVIQRPSLGEAHNACVLPLSGKPLEHLLVAIDRTPESEPAIEWSLLLAGLWGAQVTLLHVVETVITQRMTGDRRRAAQAFLLLIIELPNSQIEGRALKILRDFGAELPCDLFLVRSHRSAHPSCESAPDVSQTASLATDWRLVCLSRLAQGLGRHRGK
jgi:hypothetical protein